MAMLLDMSPEIEFKVSFRFDKICTEINFPGWGISVRLYGGSASAYLDKLEIILSQPAGTWAELGKIIYIDDPVGLEY